MFDPVLQNIFKTYDLYFSGPRTGAIASLEKKMGVVLFWVNNLKSNLIFL